MSEKPGRAEGDERPPAERLEAAPQSPQDGERVGELTVQRMVKDDGRALIAYWHSPPRL